MNDSEEADELFEPMMEDWQLLKRISAGAHTAARAEGVLFSVLQGKQFFVELIRANAIDHSQGVDLAFVERDKIHELTRLLDSEQLTWFSEFADLKKYLSRYLDSLEPK